MRRTARSVLLGALAVALVLSTAPMAMAVAPRAGTGPAATAVYRVSALHVSHDMVKTGVPFEATGSVVPTIAPGDTSTTVAVQVFKGAISARPSQVTTAAAALTGPVGSGTGFDATIVFDRPGVYLLRAVVLHNGVIVGRSPVRPMTALLPYRVTGPRVARSVVRAGVQFEASGSVVPTIDLSDVSIAVAVRVFSVGKRGALSQVATVPGTLTGPVGNGTGYAASVALPKAGAYVLDTIVTDGGVIAGRSGLRAMTALLPYVVTTPHVKRPVVPAGVAFDASGSVGPTIALDDTATTVAVRVFRIGRHGKLSLVASVAATLTGPAGKGTGYDASVTLSKPGSYALRAVVLRGGEVLGRSELRLMLAKRAPAITAVSRSR